MPFVKSSKLNFEANKSNAGRLVGKSIKCNSFQQIQQL